MDPFPKVKPVGHENLAVSTTAVPLASVPAGASRAIVTVEAQPLRYTEDGVTTPTASVGTLCVAETRFELESRQAILNFKAIRSGGTDSAISVNYYK